MKLWPRKPTIVERRKGVGGVELRVTRRDGKYRLDTAKVNYSFGALHDVFVEAFESAGVDELRPQSALVLGMGAGSVVELLNRRYPPQRIVAVELDPVVVELARRHFAIERHANLTIANECAARFLQSRAETFDLTVVDVFVENLVPEVCETDEFLADLRRVTRRMTLFNRMTDTPDNRRRNERFARQFVRCFPEHQRLVLPDNNVWIGFAKHPPSPNPPSQTGAPTVRPQIERRT
ncbi:MAG: fused MFS/spermidine synthase [Bacteroidia bacterium]|nr:fused MFS/spermidine synthase [Bacteroidia bacterium]MDW8332610.1 fused MFS/spermidine synthase [Bacteroidia bacterium]